MSTRYTLLPNAVYSDYGFNATGTTNKATALSDATDTTYLQKPANDSAYVIVFDLSTTTLGSAIPWRVRPAMKASVPATGNLLAYPMGSGGSGGFSTVSFANDANITTATITTKARTSNVSTITTSAAHGISVGDVVYVNSNDATFNGSFDVTAVTSTTFSYAQTASNVTSAAATGTAECMNAVAQWIPVRMIFGSSSSDQAAIDGMQLLVADGALSAGRSTIYKAYLDLETTVSPSAGLVTVAGIGGSVAVTAATQSGTSVTATVASHAFTTGDTVYLTGVTGLTLGTNKGVVTSTTATTVVFTVSGSATATGTVSSAVLMPRLENTSKPAIGWAYSQADSIAQYGYEVRIHNAATATPATLGASYVTGAAGTSASAVSWTVASALANATTYWVYTRVTMRATTTDYPASLVNTEYPSAWVLTQVRMDAAPPTTPTVTLAWNTASQSVTVTATGASFGGTSQTFTIQRSNDGGTTWATIRNGADLVPNGAYVVTATDYEMYRGTSVQYRAFAVGVISSGTLTSPYSSPVSVTTTSDGKHWLKNPLTPSENYGGVKVITGESFQVEEQNTVLRPLGRSDAIVVSGTIGLDDGSLTVHAAGTAEWASLQPLLFTQKVLLWQDVFGFQAYIRIISRSYERIGTSGAPRWEAKLSYVEVAAP